MGVKLLGKIKLHEIAKKIGLTSKEVVEKARELGFEAKSHLSGVDEEQAKLIEEAFKNKKNKSVDKKNEGIKETKTEKTNKKEKKNDAPVIIRREVIISDEEEEKRKQEQKQKEQKTSHVGFVERNRNNDYNIVYRNKPTKPMTVSELFGLNKKEEKKEEKRVEAKIQNNKTEDTVQKQEKIVETKKGEQTINPGKKTENNVKSNINNRQNENVKSGNKNTENKNFENKNRNNANFQNRNNQNRHNYQNRDNNFQKRDNNNYRNNQNRTYGNGTNNRFGNRDKKALDDKGIDRNIKNIMESDVVEKENQRDFSTKAIDKAKFERKEERSNKSNKNKKGSRFTGEEFDGGKLKGLKQVDKLSNMYDDQDGGMLDYYDLSSSRGKKNKKKQNKNQKEPTAQKIFQLTEITIPENITVKDLAAELKKTSAEVIKKLFGFGIMATINNDLDFDTAFLVAEEFGVTANKKVEVKEEDILFDESEDAEEDLQSRPPVVVVMGHVDHGKTSLLDAIRKTNVIEGEAGGITQAIGAYMVNINGRDITFLDTPGHEAFTSMRARGAQITDIAILVVAANDGVMPQTVEAINHAKAANVPIIVAINKIDLPDANIDKVKQELMNYELVPEEWGGDTIYVPISAKKNMNIDDLLEMVLLQADMLELKANPKKQAKGAVIEARLDKAKGPIASILVQRGTLNVGDTIVVGSSIGRIRAMKNDKGQRVRKAGPSTPVEIMGLTEVPESGETFYLVKLSTK